jgi:hypothetical protein
MSKLTPQDIQATHAVTNYLLAELQGRFAFLNILSQLSPIPLKEEVVNATRQLIDKTTLWIDDLWEGTPLFLSSHKQAETFDAQESLAALREVKRELGVQIQELLRVLFLPSPGEKTDDIAFLVATFGRYAYTRENFIRGQLECVQKLGMKREMEGYAKSLPTAQEEIKFTHSLLTIFRDGFKEVSQAQYTKTLLDKTFPLVAVFRTHIHDINQLLARYAGGLTYENADFALEEARTWESLQIAPELAGYWRAQGFNAREAHDWITTRLAPPAVAAFWKLCGFNAESATPWIQHDLSPQFARSWAKAGFSAAQAKELTARGINDPAKAR